MLFVEPFKGFFPEFFYKFVHSRTHYSLFRIFYYTPFFT